MPILRNGKHAALMMAHDGVETKLYQLHVRDPQLGLIKSEQHIPTKLAKPVPELDRPTMLYYVCYIMYVILCMYAIMYVIMLLCMLILCMYVIMYVIMFEERPDYLKINLQPRKVIQPSLSHPPIDTEIFANFAHFQVEFARLKQIILEVSFFPLLLFRFNI